MQTDDSKNSLTSLLHKIRRLRRRLLSYGWGRQQASTFILYEFLKLPQVQWDEPSCTASFYKIKQKYKVESGTAELMLCLQEVVPNLQSVEVLQYLHTVFQYSAINYGFELFESSSDSGENPRISKRPRQLNNQQKLTRARIHYHDFSPATKKKVHTQEEEMSRQSECESGVKVEEVKLVRKRKVACLSESQEWEKQLKKDQS